MLFYDIFNKDGLCWIYEGYFITSSLVFNNSNVCMGRSGEWVIY